MKKIAVLLLMIIFGLVAILSCKENEEETGIYPPDKSLAGSVYIDAYRFEAKAKYDGTELDGFQYKTSMIQVSKQSDTEIALDCYSRWGDISIYIAIPAIPLSGKSYDVRFDSTSAGSTVSFNNNKYTSVQTIVKGWIRQADYAPTHKTTRTSLARLSYLCEINIECILDGKILSLTISSVNPN